MRAWKRAILTLLIGFVLLMSVSCQAENPKPENLQTEAPSENTNIHALSEGISYKAVAKELFTFVSADAWFTSIQGAYFDGETFYVACNRKCAGGYERTKILVMDRGGKILRESKALELDHANNITYNKNIDKFIISHCQSPDKHYARYSFVDPETFEIVETGDKEVPFFSMAYSPEKNQYASGQWSGQTLDIWDGNLNHIKSVSVEQPGSLSQGVFCDSYGIYFVRSFQNGFSSEIRIYDWDCNLLRTIPLELGERIEPESIHIVAGEVYVICNDLNRVCGVTYRLTFESEM